jgi:hypothetical protein
MFIRFTSLTLPLAYYFSRGAPTQKMKSTVFLMCPGSKGVHNLSRSGNLFQLLTPCVSRGTREFRAISQLAFYVWRASELHSEHTWSITCIHALSHTHTCTRGVVSCKMCLKNLDVTKAALHSLASSFLCLLRAQVWKRDE